MRKRIIVVPLMASMMGVLSVAAPASAATTTDTTLSFTEGTGAISITAPGAATLLPSLTPSGSDQTVSADIGTVTVTDDQGTDTGWVASASATDFVQNGVSSGAFTIPISDAAYSNTAANSVSTTGTVTATPASLTSLSTTATPVLNATGVVGSNTVAWNPTLVLTVPGGTPSGTYTSTLTQSVV
jgi:hypothetical protein